MKKSLSLFRFLIKFSLTFILIFIWLRFFINSTLIAIMLSVAITLILQVLIYFLFFNHKNKLSLKSQEEEDAQNMFFSLANVTNSVDFFFNLVISRHKNVAKNREYIKIIHQNEKTTILYPLISFKSLDEDCLISIIKKTNKPNVCKLVIVCGEFDKSLVKFIKNFDIEIVLLDKFQTYSLLYKEYEFYPQITHRYSKEMKRKFSELISYSFNRSRSKAYTLSAFALFLMSFFVKINIYYYIMISVLLIFSLISLTNTKYNYKKQEELL